jgi:uroporphyrinogen decarboxylase
VASFISRRDRVFAAVAGDPPDRPPMAFWGHVYDRESTAQDLAESTLEQRQRYDWDFVKLNPRASYHGEPWGLSFRYPGGRAGKPERTSYPIHTLDDLLRLRPVPGDQGALGEQLEAIRLVRKGLPDDVLLVETVFSPLAVLTDLSENTAAVERALSREPNAVRAALEAVTRTFEDFVPRVLAAGADGIYFATVEWASADRPWTAAQYREFATPYDLRVLGRARDASFNLLHVCRPRNFLAALTDYPVAAVSWDATADGNLDLAAGQDVVRGAVIGGIGHEDALLAEDDTLALSQLERGFVLTGGRRWIVAPGCSIHPNTPPERLDALREAVLARV